MRLTVQTKLMFLMSLVLVGILSGLAVMRFSQEKRESVLFQNEENQSERFFDQIVKLHSSSLTNFVDDYSFWDEMVTFLKTRDEKWAADNIVTGLSTFRADAAWVYTTDFKLFYSTDVFSASGLSEMPVPRTAYKELFSNKRVCRFFVETPQGLMMISGASIHPTFDSQRKTPPRGYFFAGRLWAKRFIDELSSLTDFDIGIAPLEPVPVTKNHISRIAFSRPLPGWDGRPLSYLHAERERPILNSLKRGFRRQFTLYFLSALTLLALSFIFVTRWVSRPLGLISRSLDAENPVLVRELRSDTTEFGHIAKLIDRFVRQRTELLTEIGERKQAEKALREGEAHLKMAMDIAKLVHWEYDVKSGLFTFDDQFYALYGTTAEKQGGVRMSAQDYTARFIPPEEAVVVAGEIGKAMAATDITYRSQVEHHIIRTDGVRRLIVVRIGNIRDETGRIVKHYGANQDITESKRAEEDLRKLSRAVEQSPLTVVITDTRGVIEYVNPAFEKITGYSAKEAVGLNPRVLKSGAHPPEFYKTMWDALSAGDIWRDEVCNKKKNGELYWEYAEIAPVRDAQGRVTHYVAIKEDITERRRVAEELRKAKEAADAANRAKSLFLANMSHEIRTPMNAILGFSQLMQRDPSLLPAQRQNLDVISRGGEHLMELINDILEMSKIEAGRVTLNPASFDLRDMLKTLELMFRLRAETKRLRFIVSIDDGVPRWIVADEKKMKQVLINLLGNAVKFTKSGSVSLKVRTETDAKIGPRLFAEVEDTGPGISPEDMGFLFHYFEQTKAGREAGTGTGLGLVISREYARLMGGDITARSRVGDGSVFQFHMTFNEAEASASHAKTGARRVMRLVSGRPAPRVLVVEDEADEGRLLSRILSPVGFEVHLASGGEEGIREFDAWRPDLVLMDLIMPGMDGYETTRRIRAGAGGKDAKILAVTASAFEESRQKAMAAGADDFVTKPYLEDELYEKIGSRLGVTYVYADKPSPAGDRPGGPNGFLPEAIAALPEDLVRALRAAALKGDFDLVVELIARVEAIDARLAPGLRSLAERYDSPRLIDLLSGAPDRPLSGPPAIQKVGLSQGEIS